VAFPPAEMIAQGAAPVRSSVDALPAITTTHPTLAPFPNVSGALTDNCGNLVAFNLAVDVQSMQPAASPRLAWPDALKRAADLTGTQLGVAPCNASDVPAAVLPPETVEEEIPEPAEEPQTGPEAVNEDVAAEQSEPAVNDPGEPEESVDETETATADGSLDFEQPTPEPGTETATDLISDHYEGDIWANAASDYDQSGKFVTWALILAFLLMASVFAWWLYRQRVAKRSRTSKAIAGVQHQASLAEASSSEPGTVRFGTDTEHAHPIFLQLQGQLPDGESFSRQIPVSGPDWHAEIGRQDANIVLASALLSRRHARIQIQDSRVSISDLGSTNGTRLNDVPCLPGEVFLVQSGDVVQLGDVTLRLHLTAGAD